MSRPPVAARPCPEHPGPQTRRLQPTSPDKTSRSDHRQPHNPYEAQSSLLTIAGASIPTPTI
ncbi:hypothetical protein C2845_PM02G16280 [Panicum miliaceum]|uniref:Uncharacterized protein n=1 Tax=Panicum miliaceum TaxID=4540 RepID=A0A3L6S4R1_PANMI|nr:hypothetical protein C2845_PM02G16280 [Panicum miliaceum]